jgi:hypothetical protein
MNVRTADTLGYPIPTCLQHVESPYSWRVFEHKGETLFVRVSERFLKDTVWMDPTE